MLCEAKTKLFWLQPNWNRTETKISFVSYSRLTKFFSSSCPFLFSLITKPPSLSFPRTHVSSQIPTQLPTSRQNHKISELRAHRPVTSKWQMHYVHWQTSNIFQPVASLFPLEKKPRNLNPNDNKNVFFLFLLLHCAFVLSVDEKNIGSPRHASVPLIVFDVANKHIIIDRVSDQIPWYQHFCPTFANPRRRRRSHVNL